MRRLGSAVLVVGLGAVVAFSWWAALRIPVPRASDPIARVAPAEAGEDLCAVGGAWRRRVYLNVTYEAGDPGLAVAMAHRELQRREGEATYVQAGGPGQSSSLSGTVPSGTDLTWLTSLDVGRVQNISNSDSPIQQDLDDACQRLRAVEAGEGQVLDALKSGGDREVAAVSLELHRNEIRNLRQRIRSLLQESERAQVNLYFNPMYPQ